MHEVIETGLKLLLILNVLLGTAEHIAQWYWGCGYLKALTTILVIAIPLEGISSTLSPY